MSPLLARRLNLSPQNADQAIALREFVEDVVASAPGLRLCLAHAGGSGGSPASDLPATRTLVQLFAARPDLRASTFLDVTLPALRV
jgi:hypothetical protein